MAQIGRGGMGSRKHGKSGTPGHNSDLIQTARMLNKESEELSRKKESQKLELPR